MQPQKKHLTPEKVIDMLRTLKKTDSLFKPLKKLKNALNSIGHESISTQITKTLVIFHFGLGNQVDLKFVKLFCGEIVDGNPILPGKSYCFVEMKSTQEALKVMEKHQPLGGDASVRYAEVQHKNLSRTMIGLYCCSNKRKEQEMLDIEDCPLNYEEETIPGIIIKDKFLTQAEQQQLLRNIDGGKWTRLNNRRVQHFGYDFQYGANNIKADMPSCPIPHFFQPLLNKLTSLKFLAPCTFDQITINDYFAGDGIPSHFDTHSPFEEVFVSISMLSGLVMNWRRYDGKEVNTYLKERALMIFSGEGRYAWTHGISCRKVDKVGGQLRHRARRISITLRQIKQTPCTCPYYFYCDSQGYDPSTMKKSNPLLQKYLSQTHGLEKVPAHEVYQKYVVEAYNSFGYNFHNKIIQQIRSWVDVLPGQVVLDVGCGNGQYKELVKNGVYIGIESCTIMEGFNGKFHMDGRNMLFRPGVFDQVLCIAVLHHLPTPEQRLQMLREIYRGLTLLGVLYLTVFNYQTKSHIYLQQDILLEYCVPEHKLQHVTPNVPKQPTLRKEQKGEVYQRYYHLFMPEEIVTLVEKAGFSVEECTTDHENVLLKAIKNK